MTHNHRSCFTPILPLTHFSLVNPVNRQTIKRSILQAIAGIALVLLNSCTSPKDTQPDNTLIGNTMEQYRLRFHFTPQKMWMNDPNGMVYYDGEYHLFYQHFPDSAVWGPMHWGHAVSEDLIHWKHLPIALYPDSLGYIFSGSAVVDRQNTAGFKTGAHDPLVAIYTYHQAEKEKAGHIDFQTQGIAYSNDRGRTWSKYDNNPVLPNPGVRDFRDPKVFWHEESKKWVMVLAVQDRIHLYGSPDLKKWDYLSEFGQHEGSHGGVWECPDLFPLKVEDTDTEKWVLLLSINPGAPNGGSGTQYFIGTFDGQKFISEGAAGTTSWVDYGRDNYAGVTFANIPQQDGRRIFMGWMSNWDYAQVVPTPNWRSAMTLPRVLTLKNVLGETRLLSYPVEETKKLRMETIMLSPGNEALFHSAHQPDGPHHALEGTLTLSLTNTADQGFSILFSNTQGETYAFGYDPMGQSFYSDRSQAGQVDFSEKFAGHKTLAPFNLTGRSQLQLHFYLDVASIEIFIEGGELTLTEIFFPNGGFDKIDIRGNATLLAGQVYPLKSIWP